MARKKTGEAEVIAGHVLEVLASLEAESVSCVVTSPPYWSLRRYDAPDVVWGGVADCEHEWGTERTYQDSPIRSGDEGIGFDDAATTKAQRWRDSATCTRCGAWRGQYGLEPQPELYVEHTLEVLRAIRRVLRPDGVVWWNIGDGYAGGPILKQPKDADGIVRPDDIPKTCERCRKPFSGRPQRRFCSPDCGGSKNWREPGELKPKDLVLMPFRVALAAQADSWWVRSVIIWSKPNAMPESTKDRPTTAHEYVIMMTRSPRYWYDQEAVREPLIKGAAGSTFTDGKTGAMGLGRVSELPREDNPAGRNLRSVWEFPTAQTPEAHFATFPEELPRRCIEASCPREICAKCGTARVRVVDAGASSPARKRYAGQGEVPVHRGGGDRPGGFYPEETQTTGWTSCDCAEPDYQPGIVLDPFCGIGTTGVVAKRLGRRFIGVELSEKYAGMARDKLKFFWKKTNLSEPKLRPGQTKLPLG